jgi:catechol 2,3-dioxygenase
MKTDSLNVADLIQAAGEEEWTGMPAGTVVGHVHLFVGDLAAAEAFYHRGLGFDKVVWNYPGALFLSAGGYHHHLGTNTWAAGAPVATDEDARLLDWSLIVPDEASEAARSLRDAGFPVQQENDVWIATDPWGTRLRLI